MKREDVDKYMKRLGYSIQSEQRDKEFSWSLNYVKEDTDELSDRTVTVFARVVPDTKQMQLSGIIGFFTLSTGMFGLQHPDFARLFELPLIAMLHHLEEHRAEHG